MNIIKTDIEGVYEIEPKVFADTRGYFFESYNENYFIDKILDRGERFVQDNESFSDRGILRGLHFQKNPFEQGKLVRVIKGSVLDVVVDLRKYSKTFGKYYKVILSGENKKMLWVPRGFAHGFLSLEDDTIFAYKCTNFYNKQSESCLLWNDKDLNIDWNTNDPILSEKDKIGISLEYYKKNIL